MKKEEVKVGDLVICRSTLIPIDYLKVRIKDLKGKYRNTFRGEVIETKGTTFRGYKNNQIDSFNYDGFEKVMNTEITIPVDESANWKEGDILVYVGMKINFEGLEVKFKEWNESPVFNNILFNAIVVKDTTDTYSEAIAEQTWLKFSKYDFKKKAVEEEKQIEEWKEGDIVEYKGEYGHYKGLRVKFKEYSTSDKSRFAGTVINTSINSDSYAIGHYISSWTVDNFKLVIPATMAMTAEEKKLWDQIPPVADEAIIKASIKIPAGTVMVYCGSNNELKGLEVITIEHIYEHMVTFTGKVVTIPPQYQSKYFDMAKHIVWYVDNFKPKDEFINTIGKKLTTFKMERKDQSTVVAKNTKDFRKKFIEGATEILKERFPLLTEGDIQDEISANEHLKNKFKELIQEIDNFQRKPQEGAIEGDIDLEKEDHIFKKKFEESMKTGTWSPFLEKGSIAQPVELRSNDEELRQWCIDAAIRHNAGLGTVIKYAQSLFEYIKEGLKEK